jgi:predicted Zn finger-like uncharacterized protein
MPISVQCPACKQGYTLADTQAGKHVRCKSCAGTFQVPNAEDVADVLPVEEPVTARRKPPPVPDAWNFEEERPQPRPHVRQPGVPVWVWLVSGGGLLLVIVIAVVLLLTLGGGKLTPENAARIQAGMTEAEVRAILGAPTEVIDPSQVFNQNPLFQQNPAFKNNPLMGNFQNLLGAVKVCVWKSGRNTVTVQFVNDRATGIMKNFVN